MPPTTSSRNHVVDPRSASDAKARGSTITTSAADTVMTVLESQSSDRSQSSRERAATSTTTITTATCDSEASFRQLQISDRRLLKLANLAAASIDWDVLQFASATWKKKKKTAIMGGGEFNIVTRQDGVVHHILATGNIACSMTEMRNILWTTTNERHVAAMAELHGANFLSGAALYRTKSCGDCNSASSSRHDQPSPRGAFDVSVKTATFAKAHLFARDEQWCYLDFFEQQEQQREHGFDRQKFTLTMQSLRPEDVLPQGNSNNLREPKKNQLQQMTAGYSVAADPRGSFIWVSFYSRYLDINSNSTSKAQAKKNKKLDASKSTTKARLMKMAQATCYLPLIVQRRRLGAQVFANPKDFVTPLPNNKHCKCCTVALTLLVQKKRCRLCSFRVCFKCSSKQQVERAYKPNNFETVRVCSTCTRRVNAADYDDLPLGVASPACIKADRVDDDGEGTLQRKPGKSLADFLRISFENAVDASRKRALVKVAKTLLESEEEEEERSIGLEMGSLASSSSRKNSVTHHHSSVDSSNRSSNSRTMYSDDEECTMMSTLENYLHIREFALHECGVANPDSRVYPIDYQDDDRDDSVTNYPIPDDEQLRINFVQQQQLTSMTNVPELEIICAIASKEMQCAAGLVTIIADDKIHIIASDDKGYQNLVVPRAESICSHMVMSDKPLLLPHPAADIRFNKMPPVAHNNVRFYCGFPLIGPDNQVFGSVCCVDSKSHDVTQSQYAVMTKLATTAARVMEMRAKDISSSSSSGGTAAA